MQYGLYSWIELLDIIAKDLFTANEIQELYVASAYYDILTKQLKQ